VYFDVYFSLSLSLCKNGHLDIVSILLGAGVQVDAQNTSGATPMHMAVEYDYCRIIELLLKGGADLSMTNNAGYEARCGLSGSKVMELVKLTPSDATSEELMLGLATLQDMIITERKNLIDASELVKIRTKVF
jgi:ankyrin repeat protein